MKYIEVIYDLSNYPDDIKEIVEHVLTYNLGEIGFESFIKSDDGERLLSYAPINQYDRSKVDTLLQEVAEQFGPASSTTDEVEDKDWNEEWEKNYFKPVEVIPGKVLVRASFHEPDPHIPMEIIIDPKMAFGTGNHATTAGMMKLIGILHLSSRQVIDMGCGSGILGIFTMKMGAKACTSIDIDPWSVENAKQNAPANDVKLDVRLGDASVLRECPKADVFLANINRNIILNDLKEYIAATKPDGNILLSGFLNSDVGMICCALEEHGWTIVNVINPSGDWAAVHCRKKLD